MIKTGRYGLAAQAKPAEKEDISMEPMSSFSLSGDDHSSLLTHALAFPLEDMRRQAGISRRHAQIRMASHRSLSTPLKF